MNPVIRRRSDTTARACVYTQARGGEVSGVPLGDPAVYGATGVSGYVPAGGVLSVAFFLDRQGQTNTGIHPFSTISCGSGFYFGFIQEKTNPRFAGLIYIYDFELGVPCVLRVCACFFCFFYQSE